MEIKELESFYINETSQTLDVTFRLLKDNDDEIRTDQIDFDHQAVVGKTEEILANNKEKFYRKNVIEILFSDRIDYKLYSEIG